MKKIFWLLLATCVPLSGWGQSFNCLSNGVKGTCQLDFTPTKLPAPTWVLSSTTLPDATVGDAYTATILPATDPNSTSIAYTASGLPAGLTFTASSLTISGTPTASGTVTIPITATDTNGSVSNSFVVNISPAPVTTTPVASSGIAPPQLPTLASGAVAQIDLQNATSAALPARYVTFGMPLKDGALPTGDCLAGTQTDIKTKYSDGSAKFAIVTMQAPALAASQVQNLQFAPASCPTTSTAPSATDPLTITITPTSGSPVTVAVASLTNGTAWLSGANVVETRYVLPESALSPGFGLIVDHRVYADGSIRDDVSFENDNFGAVVQGTYGPVFTSSGIANVFTYGVTIADGSTTLVSYPTVNQYAGQVWHYVWQSNGPDQVNRQHDVKYLASLGIIPHFNFALGFSSSILQTPQTGTVFGPLGSNGIDPYMPTTGDRADIGIEPGWWAAWSVSQNYEQYLAAMQYAEAGVPWNVRLSGDWANVLADPNLWVNAANGSGVDAVYTSQTAPITAIGQTASTTFYTPDTAHQPDLYWLAYVTSGAHYWLDRLNGQASYGIAAEWNAMRNGALLGTANDNVIFGNQIRGGAWTLREIQEAAYANPDGTADATYFRQVANDNWNWINATVPYLTTLEGAPYGYLIDTGEYSGQEPPWQEHYFTTVAGLGYALGYTSQAGAYLAFAANWDAGQVDNLGVDAALYSLSLVASTGSNAQIYWNATTNSWAYAAPITTWAGIEAGTVAAGSSNTTATCTYWNGYCNSNGDYGILLQNALTSEIDVLCPSGTSSTLCTSLQAAYTKFASEPFPYIGASFAQSDPKFSILLGN